MLDGAPGRKIATSRTVQDRCHQNGASNAALATLTGEDLILKRRRVRHSADRSVAKLCWRTEREKKLRGIPKSFRKASGFENSLS